MTREIRVTFEPEGRSVFVLPGTSLIEAAGKAGIALNTPCGGMGTCGKCRVHVTRGADEPTAAERTHLGRADLSRGMRLACQTKIRREMVVSVPIQSRFFEQRILRAGEGLQVKVEPVVRTLRLQLDMPSLDDQRADGDRLFQALRRHDRAPDYLAECDPLIPVSVLRKLPHVLRENDGKVTVILSEGEVLDILPDDAAGSTFGVAFDVGTTTVVAILASLDRAAPPLTAACTNPQVKYGDDVVSRIEHARTSEDGLRKLQSCIADAMNELTGELCSRAGIGRENVLEAVVAGNTIMGHLLLGIDPSYIAQAPYVAAVRKGMRFPASDLALNMNEQARLFLLPNIAGFVGGDSVAVALATDLLDRKGVRMALDVGTNGEVLLARDGELLACSTAAGPAFEGARITFGMRAAEGAIEKIVIDDDVQVAVIGNVPARGICGSAIIDAVAELLKAGIVEPTGRMLPPDQLPAGLPASVRERVVGGEDGVRFILAHPEETQIEGPVYVTQRDVRQVQLAKGAMSAGMNILMSELGIRPEDLDEVLLAGAFGNYVRRSQALRIGLLPDIAHERINFVGNAAGAGARMALLSQRCREKAEEISQRTTYIELSGRADFQAAFTDAMIFPEEASFSESRSAGVSGRPGTS